MPNGTVWYCRDNGTIGWSGVTAWHASWTPTVGTLTRQATTPTVNNERVFVCIISGAVGATEPTWVLTKGQKTVDGSCTWMEITGLAPMNGDAANTPTQPQQFAISPNSTLGFIVIDTARTHYFICNSTPSVMGATEPTWNTTTGATTTDSTTTWICLGPIGSFAQWGAPFPRLKSCFVSLWAAAGNTVFVGDDHAETQTTVNALVMSGNVNAPNYIYGVDHTATFPLTGANLKTGATLTLTTSSVALTITGGFYMWGIKFNSSAAGGNPLLGYSATQIYDNCAFAMLATSPGSIIVGTAVSQQKIVWNNTSVSFASTGSGINIKAAPYFIWRNTPTPITGATIPTTGLLNNFSATGATVVLDGVDLSALGSNPIAPNNGQGFFLLTLMNCKLGTGFVANNAATLPSDITVIQSDSAGTNYQNQRYTERGAHIPELTVIRTGGASDGVTGSSWKVTTTANSLWVMPFETMQLATWNGVTGSTVNVTVYGLMNANGLPKNDQIWTDFEYLGSIGSPLATFATGSKATNLSTGTPLTTDIVSAWDSLVTARTNSAARVVGDVRKTASNPGRVFFCITAGTTASTEPSGYSFANDGNSIMDGTAVFRAGVRFSMTLALSSPQPQLIGDIYATVKAALPSTTFYIDPVIYLS